MEDTPPVQRHWFKPLMLMLGLFVLAFLVTAFVVENRRGVPPAGDAFANLTSGTSSQATVGNVNTSVRPAIPKLETEDDPFLGPANASIVVVQFMDFQCPFCEQAFATLREIAAQYGDRVKFIIRDFPLTDIHPEAQAAAEAAGCAFAQGSEKFWAYHDKLYLNQASFSTAYFAAAAQQVGLDVGKFNACVASGERKAEITEDYLDGVAAGVRGTPTFYFNGRMVQGVIPKETFAKVLDLFLQK